MISDSTNTIVENLTVRSQPASLTYDSAKNEIFVAKKNLILAESYVRLAG